MYKRLAIGTDLAEFAVMFYQTLKVRKELPIKKYVQNGSPYIVAGILMSGGVRGVSSYAREGTMGVIFEICVGGIIFCIISLAVILKRYGGKKRVRN